MNRTMTQKVFTAVLLIPLCVAGAANPGPPKSLDPAGWPQWRGPTRDGMAPAGPKLQDSWPEDGPRLVWRSASIPSGAEGGCGSVVVAEGKAFVFVHSKVPRKATITSEDLNALGWREGVPDDLGRKLDREWDLNHDAWRALKPGAEWDACVKAFTATLDPDLARKWGPFIRERMTQMKQGRPVYNAGTDVAWTAWSALTKLSSLRGKEFSSYEELDKPLDGGLNAWHGGPFMETVRPLYLERCYTYLDTVICLDVSSGKEVWRKSFPGGPSLQTGGIAASSTPAIWAGKCYATGSAGFYCLDVKDGSVIWQAKTGFSNSSPLVQGGVVYVFVPVLTAFDAKTGKVLWACDTMKNDGTSVMPWQVGGKDYLLGYNGCVDPATGKVLWTTARWGASTPVITGPDTMVVLQQEARTMKFKISPEKAEMLWSRANHGAPRGASPLVYQDYVYKTAGGYHGAPLQCFDLKTGDTEWSPKDARVGNTECSSPVLADGKVIINAHDKAVIMFKATPEKYEELGRFNPVSAARSSPAVVAGKLFLRLKDSVACYDITQYGPYVDKTMVSKYSVTFVFKQAEGGLSSKGSAKGVIQGLTITDASGVARPLKGRIEGTSLIVDLAGAVFPLQISYTDKGDLVAGGKCSASFKWTSPHMQFQECQGKTIMVKLDRSVDQPVWKEKGTYSVSGAKIAKVEVDKTDNLVRLITNRNWAPGDKVTIKYAALPAELPGVTAELNIETMPGKVVSEGLLTEFLIGAVREGIDPAKVFNQDPVDKNLQPVPADKWKLCEEPAGVFSLIKHVGVKGNTLAHASVSIYSQKPRVVQFWVGSDDGVQITVNGKIVHTNRVFRGCTVDEDRVRNVELKRGRNTVQLAVVNGGGDWGFCLRIRDEDGDVPPPGLRYMVEMPDGK